MEYSIGEKIRYLRKKRGLTQAELGRLCGMPDSQIRKYESGQISPKPETLKRVAGALQVSPVVFLGSGFMGSLAFDLLPEEVKKTIDDVLPISAGPDTALSGDPSSEGILLEHYRQLNNNGKEKVVNFAADLTKIPEYRNDTQPE